MQTAERWDQDTAEMPRILVVEDDRVDRQTIWRALRKIDRELDIQFAVTIEDARRRLATTSFRGIVLDNTLPDGFGADLAVELSVHETLSRLPVFILSGWPSPFMETKAEEANVCEVLTKDSFGEDAARRMVAAFLRREL
ncbi:MAG: response regulator [Pseudomonadota bacterium]